MVNDFLNETSASTLATEVPLRCSTEGVLRGYLAMNTLEIVENQTHNFRAFD